MSLLDLRQNAALMLRKIRVLLPILFIGLIVSDLSTIWDMTKARRLFHVRNSEHELSYWFDIYASKEELENSHFYLRARSWLEGAALVESEKGLFSRYYLENITRVREYRIESYPDLKISVLQGLLRDASLNKSLIYIHTFSKRGGSGRSRPQRVPVVVFAGEKAETYHVYRAAFKASKDKKVRGYAIIPVSAITGLAG
jgi:hypothetical protein